MKDAEVKLGDCLEVLPTLEPESVQLFVTSPPYAQGKEYEVGLDCVSDHPCEFPVSLPAMAIRVWSDPGDLICDPFCGSGSTGVAAIQESRRFIGIEQDAGYCEMARRRLEATTPPLFVPEPLRVEPPPELAFEESSQ